MSSINTKCATCGNSINPFCKYVGEDVVCQDCCNTVLCTLLLKKPNRDYMRHFIETNKALLQHAKKST